MTDETLHERPSETERRSVAGGWIILAAVVSGSTLAAVIWWIGAEPLWERFSQLSALPLLAGSLAYIAVHICRTARTSVLVPEAWSAAGLAVNTAHSFANQILPAKTGELTFPALLHSYFGSSAGAGTSYLLVIRMADLTAILAWYVVAVTGWLALESAVTSTQTIVVIFALSMVGLALFAWSKRLLLWLVGVVREVATSERLPDWRVIEFMRDAVPDAAMALDGIDEPQWRRLVAWSVLTWVAMFVVFGSSLRAADVSLGIFATVVGAAGSIVGNWVALASFGSIGTMEAGWTAGYAAVGAELASAAAAGFAAHGIIIVISGVLAFAAAAWARGHPRPHSDAS